MNAPKSNAAPKKLKTNIAAGVGYACVNPASGNTVFQGTTNSGALLNSMMGMCNSYHYKFEMF